MPKQLTTQNATITTAAVEVKTLTVSGKQVTLAVFRQLREEPLIAEDGTLNGDPWGIVNYHPDKCGGDDYSPHWHIVWQRGGDLLRSRIERDPFGRGGTEALFHCGAADRLLTAHMHDWLGDREGASPLDNPTLPTEIPGTYRRRYTRDNERPIGVFKGVPIVAKASAAAVAAHREAVREYPNGPIGPGKAAGILAAEVSRYNADLGQLLDAVDSAATVEAARRQRHRDTRTTLADLPQLFIAV